MNTHQFTEPRDDLPPYLARMFAAMDAHKSAIDDMSARLEAMDKEWQA